MLSDEEKKAIEKLDWYFEDSQGLDIAKQTTIVLNLIEKQQREIEALKIQNRIQRKQLNDAFNRGWIHEDKIKAKIEEVEKLIIEDENSMTNRIVKWFIKQLQSLLEEKE